MQREATLLGVPPSKPRTDFRDNGGTRAWRANQATWGRVPPPRGLRQRWRRLSFVQQLSVILGLLAMPWVALALFLVGAASLAPRLAIVAALRQSRLPRTTRDTLSRLLLGATDAGRAVFGARFAKPTGRPAEDLPLR